MRRLVLIVCCVMLAACGFRLQGRQQLPAVLAVLQLDAVDAHSDFTAALRHALDASGAKLVASAAPDGTVVRIVRDDVSERVLSVDTRNIPTDYELVYEVEVTVHAGDKELLAAQPFTLSRIYSFDETHLLAKEREKDVLRAALARDMAGVVLRRLSSL
jgi:LPS-assembly lipoprotein